MIRRFFVVAALAACAAFTGIAQENEEWVKPFPPFHMIGNIYWVGTWDLSTYLITTPAGNILINTGLASTVPQIKAGVEQLGFKMSDVKILTATHGHVDHVAGMADLKKMTGAKLIIAAEDAELLETGGAADFRFGKTESAHFPPVKVDQTFHDGDTIALGGTVLTAHHTPGHTKGATSFTLDVQDSGKTYHVIIANMPSINPGVKVSGMPGYPNIAADYASAFKTLKGIQVQVWLASHASQIGLHEKYKPGDPYDPNRFVDPQGFQRSLAKLETAYKTQLAKEQAAK